MTRNLKIRGIAKYVALIMVTGLFANFANAQKLVDNELNLLFAQKDTVKTDYKEPLRNAENEFEIVFSTAFLAYKTFISSQDKPSCIFSPSCSEYAVEAFRKNGLFPGWLQTFDRLSRCNAFANHTHYHFDTVKKLFYDPVH